MQFIAITDKKMIENVITNYDLINRLYNDYIYFLLITREAYESNYKELSKREKFNIKIIDDFVDINEYNATLFDHVKRLSLLRLGIFWFFNGLIENNQPLVYIDADVLTGNIIPNKYLRENNYAFLDSKSEHEIIDLKNWISKFIDSDSILQKNLKLVDENSYFNAGILIMNDHYKMKKLFREARTLLEVYPNFDDQNILNYVNSGELQVVDDFAMNYKVDNKSIHYISRKIIFYHFYRSSMPWNNSGKYPDIEIIYKRIINDGK